MDQGSRRAPAFAHKGGVIAFTVKDTMAGPVAEALAARGIGIRSGCHCAHLLVKRMLQIPLRCSSSKAWS